ncbi:MAG: tyrosine-type recombinase/integrase [Firmicutes bacterium]|jgi:site-specific recombinase XerD|nr:tyrosine-type recombinase/integrase [Bacillota bacterium]
MTTKRILKVHNKSSKPDNVVSKENQVVNRSMEIENELPEFLIDFFIYLRNAVSATSRLAYLMDIKFFMKYLVEHTKLTDASEINEITVDDFKKIKARDVNRFLGDFCARYFIESESTTYVMENHNRSLSRKKSSLSVMFKFLFRDEVLPINITDGFNPIKLPKPQPDAIKKLDVDEVKIMLEAVSTGSGLTEKEQVYWNKTKLRDKAILMLFTTYGLRLKELQQLNIDSFNFNRNEFMIYRKRGKEVLMPLNNTVKNAVIEYINNERPKDSQLEDSIKNALFLSLQNTRLTEKAIRKLVKKYTSIALGTTRSNGYSPHKLRATAASSLIEYGFSIYDVQNLLDHDNVTTTQLYAAHKKNVKKDIVDNYELEEGKKSD